jgi:DNA-binding transcriptional MerR regulator
MARVVKNLSKLCTMSPVAGTEGLLRIGELSRRTGVKPDLLRAWERRYGLLAPERTSGGFRLYPEAAVARVEAMRSHLADGLSAAEAARLASVEEQRPTSASPAALLDELRAALDGYDEPRAQAVLDRMLAAFTLETVLRNALLPYLRELGERWESGEVSVAQEHFASSLIRGRLLGLARGWGSGGGPLAVLACPPGEEHDLGLLALGVVLHDRGWRVAYLGPDTPMGTLADAAARLKADCVVLAALSRERLSAVEEDIARLGRTHRVALAGSGASPALADETGALFLSGGPVDEAERLAGMRR